MIKVTTDCRLCAESDDFMACLTSCDPFTPLFSESYFGKKIIHYLLCVPHGRNTWFEPSFKHFINPFLGTPEKRGLRALCMENSRAPPCKNALRAFSLKNIIRMILRMHP